MRFLFIAAVALLLLLTACAGPNGEGVGPVVADDKPKVKREGSYHSAQGAMSDYDVQEAFKELHPRVVRCVEKGTA